MKQALQASSNRNLTRILWRVQSENAEKMKMLVRKLELCEYQRVWIFNFISILLHIENDFFF